MRVVVWVGRQPQVFEPGQPLRSLPLWARPALRAQLEHDPASAPQGRPPRWPPTLSDVLMRLRAGGRAQNGGGRYYSVYYFQDGRLRRTIFDEGATTDEEAGTESLAADIARHPEYFV